MSVSTGNSKQDIHVLERQPPGLWDEEVHEWNRECQTCAEDEVGAIADVGQHVRHAARDDEIEQPMSRRRYGDAETADAETVVCQFDVEKRRDEFVDLRKDLAAVNPGNSRPGSAEANCIDVDHHRGAISTRCDGCRLGVGGDGVVLDNAAKGPHGDSLSLCQTLSKCNGLRLTYSDGTSTHEEARASELVDQPVHHNDNGYQANDTVHASGDQPGIRACEADALEDAWGIVLPQVSSVSYHFNHWILTLIALLPAICMNTKMRTPIVILFLLPGIAISRNSAMSPLPFVASLS